MSNKFVDAKIEHAEKAMNYCALIKKGINGLCQILDLGDDPFDEMSRLQTYKAMFGYADKWEKQYAEFVQEQDEAPVMEQSM